MSVRKRKWTTRKGEAKEGWVVDYVDQSGKRHIQTFARKKEADDYHATVKVHVRQGIHTAHSKASPWPKLPRVGSPTPRGKNSKPQRSRSTDSM